MSTPAKLYRRLPVPLQHAGVTAFGVYWHWLRFGPGFASAVSAYQSRERWTSREWERWQQARLRVVLAAAAERIPYYQSTWTVEQRSAAARGEIASLPLLEKGAVRADPEQFIDPTIRPRRPLVFPTSGSTGTPISTYWTARELRASVAVREVRSACWAGVSFRQPRATFSGRIVVPDPESKGPCHRFNLVERQAYLSAFHIRPDTAQAYVDALRKHRIVWATGYAVSYYLLARNILDANIEAPRLAAVVTTSEKLNSEMRGVIGQAFSCPVYEEYSSVENAVFVTECEAGSLHVSPDVSIVEILREDGSPCEPEEQGEVVTTSLDRDLQPLIRYRLGDIASWSAEPCSCQRSMPVLREVTGRLEDVLTGPDGREMVRFHGIFVDLPAVVEGQVVQRARDRFVVRVVPSRLWTDATERSIVERMQQRLGADTTVSVERVAAIPRSSSGKFRAVVRELDN